MQWKREYTYDAAGNRTEIDKDDGSGTTTYDYTYNHLMQLTKIEWPKSSATSQNLYTYDDNGNLATKTEQVYDTTWTTSISWTYTWDVQDRLTAVAKNDQTVSNDDLLIEFKYCATCGGALSERVEYDGYVGGNVVSWLRYEYEGLNLLRIDERYDDDDPANGIDSGDPWRPLNVFVHAPGSIGQIVRSKWYNYRDCTTTPCDSGYYYYFYDALGNVAGVYDENTDEFIDYEMDAFGNDLPGGNAFLAMDQCGPKEHLTGKMYDTDTGLYYFSARWYDPEVGRFVGRDAVLSERRGYHFSNNSPLFFGDPTGLKSCYHIDTTAGFGFLPWSHSRFVQQDKGWWISTELAPNPENRWVTQGLTARVLSKSGNYKPRGTYSPVTCWVDKCLGNLNLEFEFGSFQEYIPYGYSSVPYAALERFLNDVYHIAVPNPLPGQTTTVPVTGEWHPIKHNCNHYTNYVLELCGCNARMKYTGKVVYQ